jgi:hypothetical protein
LDRGKRTQKIHIIRNPHGFYIIKSNSNKTTHIRPNPQQRTRPMTTHNRNIYILHHPEPPKTTKRSSKREYPKSSNRSSHKITILKDSSLKLRGLPKFRQKSPPSPVFVFQITGNQVLVDRVSHGSVGSPPNFSRSHDSSGSLKVTNVAHHEPRRSDLRSPLGSTGSLSWVSDLSLQVSPSPSVSLCFSPSALISLSLLISVSLVH